jgi:hypothetical protein
LVKQITLALVVAVAVGVMVLTQVQAVTDMVVSVELKAANLTFQGNLAQVAMAPEVVAVLELAQLATAEMAAEEL